MLRQFACCMITLAAVLLAAHPGESQDKAAKDAEAKPTTSADIYSRITAALEWLEDHQHPEGHWSASTFSADSARSEAKKTHNLEWVNPGKPEGDAGKAGNHDVAWTSLALLAFVGSGYDHKEGEYRSTVRLGILSLRKIQDNDGCFGEGKCSSVHDHAVATMAISELYGLSLDPILKPMADKGVEYLLAAQNEDGGWGAGKGVKESDTQMTGWCVLALKSARMAGLQVDTEKAWKGANKWLDSVSAEVKGDTRTGYKRKGDQSPRTKQTAKWVAHPDMEAVNITSRLFSDHWDLQDKDLKSQSALLAKDTPVWADKKVDMAYWYFGSLALFQVGGEAWKTWSAPLTKALLDNQRGWRPEDKDSTADTLDEHGSWDAVGAWHPWGGRVGATAMGALTLQVHARYLRIRGQD